MRNPAADAAVTGGTPPSTELRAALLSVYYASLGSEFEVRGAPSVYLPPQINLLPLAEALRRLSVSPTRLREAIWLLVRASSTKGSSGSPLNRKPPELDAYVTKDQWDELVEVRHDYRSGASLFSAALVACRDEDWTQVELLEGVMEKLTENRRQRNFSRAIAQLFGNRTAPELLRYWRTEQPRLVSEQIQKLESEVGLDLNGFVVQFADAVAFQLVSRAARLGTEAQGLAKLPVVSEQTATVLPVSSVIVQDTATLATRATVTTIVTADFDQLRMFTDPLLWAKSSDVIQSCRYVADPFPVPDHKEIPQGEPGMGFVGAKLLEERAAFSWGQDNDQRASFHNILRIEQSVDSKHKEIDVDFSLSRSIDSEVLWDRRTGGLLVNQGYLKVRQLGRRSWRVTSRKTIRFSDRTPGSPGRGRTDFGQLLNYLAPTALSWWVETETYSLGDRPVIDAAPDPIPEAEDE